MRIFEWNGSMMHAKTAVADCRWARVGSSNLNIASWIGNYELDVAVDDTNVRAADGGDVSAGPGERDRDRAQSRAIACAQAQRCAIGVRWRSTRTGGSASRAAAGALRIGNTVSAALTNRRVLGPAEAGVMAKVGAVLVALAVAGILWPVILAIPFAIMSGWIGLALLARAFRLRSKHRSEAEEGDKELPEPIGQTAASSRRSADT